MKTSILLFFYDIIRVQIINSFKGDKFMKRFLLKTILPAFLLLGAASLSACNSNKLPSSDYEKVKFAFNGVEKSFASPKVAKKSLSLNKRERLGGSNTESGLSTIFNLYTEADKQNDFLDDVEYNQPPMVQFQYLKKVLEKVGSGYEFGTKYFDTVTGEVLLDIETGLESKNADDKFNYTFGLGMDINIGENDLITADVSFDIKIVRGQEEYNTKWYVAIELNYDMQNTSPNYTMTMVTENNESELPYYQHYTYEYDYVEVKNSGINEWRKFCMDNNNRLVKDSAHPNFDSYAGANDKYKVDACSWYKDGTYYKNKRPRELNGSEAKTVGQALFGDLGLNATEINADAFFAKASTPNSVLKTCYQEFSKIAKKDIIYDLLTREEQGGDQQQQQKAGIKAVNPNSPNWSEDCRIPKETTLRQVFGGFIDAEGTKTVIQLYYTNQNGGLLDVITDLNRLTFFFGVKNKPNTVMFESLDETLESAYNELFQNGQISEADISDECAIFFTDNENPQSIYGGMQFYYSGDLPNTYVKPEWPNDLKTLGVPEYDGEKVQYSYNGQNERKTLNIANSTFEEGDAYCRKLIQNGFEESYDIDVPIDELLFKKAISDEYNLYVVFKYGKNIDNFVLTAWQEAKQSQDPVQPFHVYAIGDFNNWGKNDTVEFEASYADEQWTFVLENFHAEANESFAFVKDPNHPEQGFFGYHHLVDDPGDLFCMDNEKGEYAFKAMNSFTATFTADENGRLHVNFSETQNGIRFLTIVGSFNGWSETDGVIEMNKKDGVFSSGPISFDEGVEFKVMQDHSWAVNYGYNEIKAVQSADMKARFASSGEYGNIKLLQPLTFVLTATDDGGGHAVFKINII